MVNGKGIRKPRLAGGCCLAGDHEPRSKYGFHNNAVLPSLVVARFKHVQNRTDVESKKNRTDVIKKNSSN
jgi:hypothetical protein